MNKEDTNIKICDILQLSMTVCIAALAEGGKKAILIADKLVTTVGILPYQTDMAADKIVKINENVSVLYAGGIADATIIIENVKNNLGQNKYVQEIADLFNLEHLNYLISMLTHTHLAPRGIKSNEQFYEKYSHLLQTKIGQDIDIALGTHTLNSNIQFIVCGKDKNQNYKILYLNSNPRFSPLLMTSGFSMIGSGWNYANFSILQSDYRTDMTSEIVEKLITKAKKEAEKDRDVGTNEDIIILE